MSKTYWELLRDPRWQRVRLEVMQRAGFKCEFCGDSASTLNIHHTYYERGKKPWEYPEQSLKCLCETCHESLTHTAAEIGRIVGGLELAFQRSVLGTARTMQSIATYMPRVRVEDRCVAEGVSFVLGCSIDDVWAARDESGHVAVLDVFKKARRAEDG